ncbi:MAG: nuclear transport factor 2 family protein [Micromonosporaceae bacterium]
MDLVISHADETRSGGTPRGEPPDPVAFAATAERMTNTRDLDGVIAGYSDDAVLESITDGAREVHRGRDELRAAWSAYFAVMRQSGFRLTKQLLAADDEWITNSWHGTMAGAAAYGLQAWRFGPDGHVISHLLYSSTCGRQPIRWPASGCSRPTRSPLSAS